jgi:hypothetical protein
VASAQHNLDLLHPSNNRTIDRTINSTITRL